MYICVCCMFSREPEEFLNHITEIAEHLELEKYLVSRRKGDIDSKEAQYRQACEEWGRQVGEK